MLVNNDATGPWQKVGADLFQLSDRDYLIVIDYLNYPEVALLSSTSSNSIIKHMKSIFGRHGIPYTLMSDNGPQFACAEFKNFADYYGLDHVTSSPYYAQSNGKSEKGFQIVKRMWKKCLEEHSDPYLALLAYRAAPLQSGQSPAKLLIGRPLRTRLPVMSFNGASASSPQVSNQASQKYYYDRSAKPLPELQIGNPVRLYGNGGWTTKGTVKDCLKIT